MSISPKDLFEFAESLTGSNSSEVSLRTVAGRSYYASFHRCTQFCEAENLPEPEYADEAKGVHDTLIKKFTTYKKNSNDARALALRAVGFMLQNCREIRVRADYKITSDWNSNDTEQALRFYGRIENKLSSL